MFHDGAEWGRSSTITSKRLPDDSEGGGEGAEQGGLQPLGPFFSSLSVVPEAVQTVLQFFVLLDESR